MSNKKIIGIYVTDTNEVVCGVTESGKRIYFSEDIVGITTDGRRVFSGKTLFNMKATHGLPLDFALDIIKDADCVVDWIGFIDTARKNKWWDFQTLPVIAQCTSDAGYTQEEQDAIITRLKIYVTNNEHPELK